MSFMGDLRRFAAVLRCPCGRPNEILLPETECGTEFDWIVRCRGCGRFGWFHAKEDRAFGEAIRATASIRGEEEGLSEEGTREAHARFAAKLAPCACGGRFTVVRKMEDEPCLGCARPLRGAPWPDPSEGRQVEVPPLSEA